MSDFFARPARGPELAPPPQPPWAGPPAGVLPGVVAAELLLVGNARVGVFVGRCAAYPTGFEFDLRVVAFGGANDLDPSLNGVYARPGTGPDGNFETMMRFGVEFSDGRRATNLEPGPGGDPAGDLVLWSMGGRGGVGRWQQDFWVWPLPPEGPLRFVCEWPAAGVELTRTEIDAALIREAADRARAVHSSATGDDRPRGN